MPKKKQEFTLNFAKTDDNQEIYYEVCWKEKESIKEPDTTSKQIVTPDDNQTNKPNPPIEVVTNAPVKNR